MKIGYSYALRVLFKALSEQDKTKLDERQRKSLLEGIEYLCLPFREDVDSYFTSKMLNPFTEPRENIEEYFKNLSKEEKNELTKRYFLLNSEANRFYKLIQKMKV